MNSLLTKSYKAEAAIAAYRAVKMGAADYQVLQATDGASPIAGVSEALAVALGGSVDVIKHGLAYLELGGVVARGQWLVADANGKGVAANIVAGTTIHVIGRAEISGVAGDLIPVDVQPTVIGADGIAEATVTVTSAELLALNAAPKTLIAAPGAGSLIVLEGPQRLWLDFNTVAYAGIAAGEDLSLRYQNGAGAEIARVEATGFLDGAADEHRTVYPGTLAVGEAAAIEPLANQPVVLHMLVGEIITGNSPLKVRVRYRVVALEFA